MSLPAMLESPVHINWSAGCVDTCIYCQRLINYLCSSVSWARCWDSPARCWERRTYISCWQATILLSLSPCRLRYTLFSMFSVILSVSLHTSTATKCVKCFIEHMLHIVPGFVCIIYARSSITSIGNELCNLVSSLEAGNTHDSLALALLKFGVSRWPFGACFLGFQDDHLEHVSWVFELDTSFYLCAKYWCHLPRRNSC